MRVLVTGAGGRLGRALQHALRGHTQVSAFAQVSTHAQVSALDRARLNITDPAALDATLARIEPQVIVNTAAWTDVAAAERDPAAASRVNADAVGQLGAAAARSGAFIVHISTDFVFDGRLGRAYREADATGPLNAYGAGKLAGERALLESGAACAILRTAWLYDADTPNFVTAMLDGARHGRALRVVTTETGSPTAAPVLAAAVRLMLLRGLAPLRAAVAGQPLFHVACRGAVSRYDLARAALAEAGLDPAYVEPQTGPLQTGIVRPAATPLNCARFERTFGVRLPHWRAALRPVARVLRPDGA